MEPSPAAGAGPTLADMGFGTSRLLLLLLIGAALPASLTAAAGGPVALLAAAALGGTLVVAVAATWLRRRLRRQVWLPLEEMMRSLDQLRSTGHSTRVRDDGAPMLQPLLRCFQLACTAIEERTSRSQANLMTVESAFERVHAVLQALREGVIVVDRRGCIAMINRSARNLLVDQGTLEGRPLAEVVDGDLRQALGEDLLRLDRGDADQVGRSDLAFGGRIFDLTVARMHSNRPGQDFGRVVVLADVTHSHEVNALKDELLSSISHELRTPLTNMCSSSEILASLTPDDEATWREFATMLNAESRRLKLLVDDVMEYSQLETKRTQWNPSRVDLAELARSAAALVRPLANGKQIELTCRASDTAFVVADGARLVEVMCRLLDNAIKFTPAEGRVEIVVSTEQGMVAVAIADSGIGIPTGDRERVFERFTQVGSVMTEKPPGTGLGLSITRRIIDAQGGTIWCEDSPLGGAQFRFVLPAAGS